MGNEIWSIYNVNISKYEYLTRKINNLLTSCVSVVVSGDFFRFRLALPSLLFPSPDKLLLAERRISEGALKRLGCA